MENYDIQLILFMKRKALGYSQKKVSELCDYAFTERTLRRWENGEKKIRQSCVPLLLKLYRQRSCTICSSMDLIKYSYSGMYNKILAFMFQGDYKEALRKLELFENYVDKESKESLQYLEVLKRGLRYYSREVKLGDEKEIEILRGLIGQIVPEGVDIEKWAFTRIELNTYLTFLNVLSIEKRYREIVQIARKLLVNIEQKYQNMFMFADFHGCFSYKLIRALWKENICEEIRKFAEKSLDFNIVTGNISNTYLLQGELLYYMELNSFFDDSKVREQCLEVARKMYYLCIICDDEKRRKYFKRYLKRIYNYTELY